MKTRWLFAMFCCLFLNSQAQQPVIITYIGGYRGNLINTDRINTHGITHLLYAFADVSHDRAFLRYPKTDVANLHHLVKLKKINPSLKILLSAGGLGWSRNFSDMALTENGRKTFAASCITLVNKYALDGIDIDWEFPGYAGEGGNIYRKNDKEDFTLLFIALRDAFNTLQKQTGKNFELTVAVDGWATHFLPHTQMDQVQQYVDYICLMTYNFNTPQLSGGHFLYSPQGWDMAGSVNGAVNGFLKAGVPASKLVIGVGFFPAAMKMRTGDPYNRHYMSKVSFLGGLSRINKLAGKNGWKRYWDKEGKAPYLFNSANHIRIAYEDTSSVKAKCNYILQHNLAGIMYWDYFSDPGRCLLKVINKTLRK